MKRVLGLVVLLGALVFAVGAIAETKEAAKETKSAKAPKSMTIKGELVDMACYVSHGAMGEKHKDCATKCVAGGMPMGVLTSDNKLYLLTMNHDNPDPFNQAKEMMAAQVEVTGNVSERNGQRIIDVTELKAATAAAAK
jgi:hypothetical protein